MDSDIERLLKLDSCAVSDAMDSLVLPGAVTGIKCLTGSRRIAGKVLTVRLGPADPAVKSSRHLCTGAIEAADAGNIIVVEQRTGVDAAGWGGVLSNAARQKELGGVIVEGPARDIDESATLDFAVFARNATARTARGRVMEVEFNGPVRIGEVDVHPGDLVIADSSGIVFLPAARASEILAAAEKIAAKEALMTKAVWRGQPVGAVMGADYETMLRSNEQG